MNTEKPNSVVSLKADEASSAGRARACTRDSPAGKAPSAFDDDLDELLEMFEIDPHTAGARIAERPRVRRVLLGRVRYHVYFTVGETVVTIIAVWHASRGSRPGI